MTREFIELLLENIEASAAPIQVDWNNKELYIKGIGSALDETLKAMGYVIREADKAE